MWHPQVTKATPSGEIPGRVFKGKLGRFRNEGLVLENQWNTKANICQGLPSGHQRRFGIISDQIPCGLTGINVQAGNTPGMIVVEAQASALLVGIEQSHSTGTRIGHVWNVCNANALRVRRGFISRGRPLVWGTITDPG